MSEDRLPQWQAVEITPDQYQMLMQGLEVIARHPIRELADPSRAM